MDLAKAACDRGKLSSAAFDALRTRFNLLHDQAVALFGESALLEAIEQLDPRTYAPPSHATAPASVAPRPRSPGPFSFPAAATADLPFSHPVTEAALAEVDSIRDQALALGWTEAEIYQTRGRFAFPCGNQYGLVCFLSTDHHVGPVTEVAIEIHCSGGAIQRLYRRRP